MEQKSDRRLKENITDTAVKALDKINRLRMVAFDFIENKKHEEIGLIAQEAETIVPKLSHEILRIQMAICISTIPL